MNKIDADNSIRCTRTADVARCPMPFRFALPPGAWLPIASRST